MLSWLNVSISKAMPPSCTLFIKLFLSFLIKFRLALKSSALLLWQCVSDYSIVYPCPPLYEIEYVDDMTHARGRELNATKL